MSELGDKLAQHFKPDGIVRWGAKGQTLPDRVPADGSSSAMIVFLGTDGVNSMRALTFDEIAEAVEKLNG